MAVTKLLLMNKANIHNLAGKNLTILHSAVYNGSTEFMKMLLVTIVDEYSRQDLEKLLAAVDLNGYTPVTLAIDENRAGIIELFVTFGGVDVEHRQYGLTLLHHACMDGFIDIVKLLIGKKGGYFICLSIIFKNYLVEVLTHVLGQRAMQSHIYKMLIRIN